MKQENTQHFKNGWCLCVATHTSPSGVWFCLDGDARPSQAFVSYLIWNQQANPFHMHSPEILPNLGSPQHSPSDAKALGVRPSAHAVRIRAGGRLPGGARRGPGANGRTAQAVPIRG